VLVVIIVVVIAMGMATMSAATVATAFEHSPVLAVVDSWLQPSVEARPAVEVATAGHNRLVGHCLKADGAWEPPIVTSQGRAGGGAVRCPPPNKAKADVSCKSSHDNYVCG
jgi:hypothetical protein